MGTVRKRGRRASGLLAVGVGVAVLASVLGGCGGGEHSAGSVSSADRGTALTSLDTAAQDAAVEAVGDGNSEPSAVSGSMGQQVVVTGSATLSTADPAGAMEDLSAAVVTLGGSTAQSGVTGAGADRSAWATYRVPADAYDGVLARLDTFGTVSDLSTTTEDVGAQVADVEARIKALQSSVTRLGELMAKADSTADLLEAESQMTSRQAELDALKAQRAWLADQVSMSTLSVSFTSQPVRGEPSGSVWQRSWDAFVSGMKDVVVALIWVAPWLIVLVPVSLLLWWLVWARRRPGSPGGTGARRASVVHDEDGDGRTADEADPPTTTAPDSDPTPDPDRGPTPE